MIVRTVNFDRVSCRYVRPLVAVDNGWDDLVCRIVRHVGRPLRGRDVGVSIVIDENDEITGMIHADGRPAGTFTVTETRR